jgi:hypothetical protein
MQKMKFNASTKRGNGGHIFVPQAVLEHTITAFDQPIIVGAFDE